MDFVADESCAMQVVRSLRASGHNIVAIAEVARGVSDDEVLSLALSEQRIVITEDRDFGELVYARGRSSAGVVLVRFHSDARNMKAAAVLEAVNRLGIRLMNAFTVVEPGRVRMSKRP